jgi:UDPglucose--hexose-1-phosphate uridylyltransferase
MPELRKDPVIGRWVIISSERGKRPDEYKSAVVASKENNFCPFCPGNEDKTPPEVLAIRDPKSAPNTPGWQVRVVPNKFPALQIEGDLGKSAYGIYDRMRGIGAHEVLIESPYHDKTLAYLPPDHVEKIFDCIRNRCTDLKKDSRFRYILVFKNWGREAGASIEHSHIQLIATPIIPKRAMEELNGAKFHYQLKERCIFCDIINQEVENEIRIICRNEHFIAISPYASRFPFETWILPLNHISSFESTNPPIFSSLSEIVRIVLQRLDKVLAHSPFNFIIHTAPCESPNLEYYHWHIEIMPKLTRVAGFEWGSGFYINPTPPEIATEALRAAEIEADDVSCDDSDIEKK